MKYNICLLTKKSFCFVLFFFVFLCFSVEGQAKTIRLQSPGNGDYVNLSNPEIRKWWNNYREGTTRNSSQKEYTNPDPVKLVWEKVDGYTYKVYVSTKPDFSHKRVYDSRNNTEELTMLYRDTKYYWKVIGIKGKHIITSNTRMFRTNNITRFIKVKNVPNFRDLGGYETYSNKEIKQGLIYRSSNLDKIPESEKRLLKVELNIKTDLDLREKGEGKGGTKSPAGLKYIHIAGTQYEQAFKNKYRRSQLAKEVKVFANKSNYPIVFHCTYGRDRTGTLAFMINGLLGVTKKDLFRDYELTYMTKNSSSTAKERLARFKDFYNQMRSYRNSKRPLSYNIECYLLDNGVTKGEIASIKNILLK